MFRTLARPASIAAAALAFAACSDPVSPVRSDSDLGQSVQTIGTTPIAPGSMTTSYTSGITNTRYCNHSLTVSTPAACPGLGLNAVAVTTLNTGWTLGLPGASWISFRADANTYGPQMLPGFYTYQMTFNVAAGDQNRVLNLELGADNGVAVYLNGNLLGTNGTTENTFAVGFKLSADGNVSLPAGPNTLTFVVQNTRVNAVPAGFPCPSAADNSPNYNAVDCANPTALIYKADYSHFEPVQELIPMFVIGDVEPHAVGDIVNFWGAQWWKNNQMSGIVSNGVASFKGYATQAGLTCGGTWVSRPGNSSNPPATISSRIAVIVTSKVIKNGPDISGDIKQIVLVDHDGKYGPNPGHRGNGVVKVVQCGQ